MNALHLLLREKQTLFTKLFDPKNQLIILLQLVIAGSVGIYCFGASMGSFTTHWWWPWQLGGKTLLLFWGTFGLCFPSLFVFSALRGSRITLEQLFALFTGCLASIGVVLAALLPIAWFFSWTDDGSHYSFIVRGIYILSYMLAFLFGVQFLIQGFVKFHHTQRAQDPSHRSAMGILVLWGILAIIVGMQMIIYIGPWYE